MKKRSYNEQELMEPIFKNSKKQSKNFEKDQETKSQDIKVLFKEINKILDFMQEREKISNLIKKFISISEKYANDIDCLTLDLNQNEISFVGKINSIFHDILIVISNSIKKMIKNISEQLKYQINNSQINENEPTGFKFEIQKLQTLLINSVKTTENDKKLYLDECEKFEDYLVKKELTPLTDSKNNFLKKNGSYNFEIIDFLVDNHLEVYEKQNIYKRSKETSNKIIQQILSLILKEKTIIHKDIYDYLSNFVNQIQKLNQIQNNSCLKNKKNLSLPILQLNYEKEQKIFQFLLNPDYYYFKCLENINNSFNESKTINNTKSEYKILNEEQIINIFKEVKKNKIMISDSDEKKLNIAQKCNNIISIMKLIVSEKKYDEKLKNEFINLLKTDKDNLKSFIHYLNRIRGNSMYILSKNAFDELTEIFTIIIEYLVEKQDYVSLRQIFLMSTTFFINKNGKKKFLCQSIQKLKVLDEIIFWENYLEVSIIEELKIFKNRSQNSNYDKDQKSSIIFSCILNVIQTMNDYNFDKKFIITFLEKHVYIKYRLNEEKKEEIGIIIRLNGNSGKNDEKNNCIKQIDEKMK